jgi:dienelactone hydrolase
MNNKTVEYFDGQQQLIGQLFFNEEYGERQPAIILFPAFEGRSQFALDYASQLAEQGYVVLAADMYGDARTANTIDGCFNLITPFLQDRSLVRRRAQLAYEALLQQDNVDKTKVGAIGFCFGGMCVLELARSGVDLQAGVTMHGVLAKSNLPTHPIKSKLLILHGYQDPQVPPEQLQPFTEEMENAGVTDWTFTFFSHAKHSFTDPLTGTFDPQREKEMGRAYHSVVAERAFRYTVDFFAEHLVKYEGQ